MSTTTLKAAAIGSALALTPVAAISDGLDPKDVADMLHAVIDSDRTIYTRMIVERLVAKHKLIKASEFYDDDVAAPLPAQMFRFGS